MDPIVFLRSVKTISATTLSIIRLIDYFAGHEPLHVKERLGRSLELMSKYMHEKNQSEDPGDAWRNDWFSENQVSNHRTLRRVIEKTIKEIINDSEERKSEYIAKFWVNICRTSNSDIDEGTAFSYLDTIESLSWRQLCIIRFVILCENKEVDTYPIKEIEQKSENDRSAFYFISRDFDSLINDGYIQLAETSKTIHAEPYLRYPSMAWTIDYTKRLHSLMNLYEIPMNEIIETFSLWNVRAKKSE